MQCYDIDMLCYGKLNWERPNDMVCYSMLFYAMPLNLNKKAYTYRIVPNFSK